MENYKEFEERVFVEFGNYLLSKERDNTIENEQLKDKVTDADLKNWETLK